MANNYTYSSSLIEIPKDKHDQARAIIARVTQECEDDPDTGYAGFSAVLEDKGVWLRDTGESFIIEQGAALVEALVEELSLPGIHVVSWANTCDKPRIDEFGGGAFAVQMGKDTCWSDAASDARRRAELLVQTGAPAFD